MTSETSLPANPDVAQAANEMDAHARLLDQQAAAEAARAAKIKDDAREVGQRLVADATRAAEQLIAEKDRRAAPHEQTAQKLRAQAGYWHGLAAREREKAEVDPPEQAPFGRPLNGHDDEYDPKTWTGPDGRVWDLHIAYADSSGQRWHWAGGFTSVDGYEGMWPLMSHDDYGIVDVPLCRCPAISPVDEMNLTGPFPAEVSDQTTATPAAGVTVPDEAGS